jgi:exopolyphosphatase/guanosine-5'-triphosphate,3'-diphosphate pyrophosphatase
LHRLGQKEREWLEYAAVLHDIGYLINERQHHKHAYYLIKNSDLAGFTADEIDIVANVARYHRRSVPLKKHEAFTELSDSHQRTVRTLASLLRIADALDRSHFSVVDTLDVKLGDAVTIKLHVTGDAELETWAARSRADLFEQVFHRRVRFIQPSREGGAA